MDTSEVNRQAQRIDYNERGISWIRAHLFEKTPLSHSGSVDMEAWIRETRLTPALHAKSLPGFEQANSLLNMAMREFLPKIIERAVEIGETANAEAKQIIKDEVAK